MTDEKVGCQTIDQVKGLLPVGAEGLDDVGYPPLLLPQSFDVPGIQFSFGIFQPPKGILIGLWIKGQEDERFPLSPNEGSKMLLQHLLCKLVTPALELLSECLGFF